MIYEDPMVYIHSNTNYLHVQIKQVLKDEYAGKLTREEAAICLRSLADKMEAKREDLEQMSLFTLAERLQKANVRQSR